MKCCLTIFGEEGPRWLWQSVELGSFLCIQGLVSGEVGRGKNVELALAAVCARQTAAPCHGQR